MSESSCGKRKGRNVITTERKRRRQNILLNVVMDYQNDLAEMHRQQGKLISELKQSFESGTMEREKSDVVYESKICGGRRKDLFKMTHNFILSEDVCTDWTFECMFNVSKPVFTELIIEFKKMYYASWRHE